MKEFKAVLLVGNTEIDYMVFDSETLTTAGHYTEERFNKAYPEHFKQKEARIEIEEIA